MDKVKETWRKKYRENLKENNAWLSNLSQAFIDAYNPEQILDYEQRVNKLSCK